MKTTEGLTAEQIVAALEAGELDQYIYATNRSLRRAAQEDVTAIADQGARGGAPTFDDAWVKAASPDEIVDAFKSGALDPLLRGER